LDFIAGPVSLHHAAEAYTPFSDEEVRRLERFTDRVRALGNSSFFEHPGHRMKATFTQGYVFDVRVDSPGEEAVRAVMPLFRELYTDENPTSARAVLNILRRHARARGTVASKAVLREMESLRNALTERKQSDPRAAFLEEGREGPRPPREIIDVWLNGEYFHFDEPKAVELAEGGGAVEPMRMILHSAVRDFAQVWKHIAVRVEAALDEESLRR
jgi:hypothetical protein